MVNFAVFTSDSGKSISSVTSFSILNEIILCTLLNSGNKILTVKLTLLLNSEDRFLSDNAMRLLSDIEVK